MRTFKTSFKALLLGVLLVTTVALFGKDKHKVFIHSHNDYRQRVPFYQAYSQQVSSIEADIFIQDGKLLVGHDPEDMPDAPTLDEAYIDPIVNLFEKNKGKPWKGSDEKLQLMIELKNSEEPAMKLLVEKLEKYPEVFNPKVNPNAAKIFISGAYCPSAKDFDKYPEYIKFDGTYTSSYTPKQLERVGFFSEPFYNYAKWNGKGTLKKHEVEKIKDIIQKVHAKGKMIRFWATPDGITAWNTLHEMGVDVINTDRPEACSQFFRNFENKNYEIKPNADNIIDEIAKTDRLDKTTAGFQGFDLKKLQLTAPIPIYTPTYKSDEKNVAIKNIIFIIGDGTGLAQVQTAATVNKGLTLFKIKNIGLQNTSSEDAYTTDSAAGGSALATGKRNANRHISMSDDGQIYPSLTDVAYDLGMSTGVVTWGNIADATPAAFYGHAKERDDADIITDWLLKGKLNLLNGSGMHILTKREDKRNLADELKSQYNIVNSIDKINEKSGKTICIDERMEQAADVQTVGLLAEATREAIKKLSQESKKGFFLMVEEAKIDYAGHANSLPGSIVETLSLDMTVAEALKFADKDGQTLVIITGDHETGGLTLVDGNLQTGKITAQFMTDDHTPIMLPVYAYGPHSQNFKGIYDNIDIFTKIKNLLKK